MNGTRHLTAGAPAISAAEYQSWEIRRYLALHDPAFLRELEAAE